MVQIDAGMSETGDSGTPITIPLNSPPMFSSPPVPASSRTLMDNSIQQGATRLFCEDILNSDSLTASTSRYNVIQSKPVSKTNPTKRFFGAKRHTDMHTSRMRGSKYHSGTLSPDEEKEDYQEYFKNLHACFPISPSPGPSLPTANTFQFNRVIPRRRTPKHPLQNPQQQAHSWRSTSSSTTKMKP